MTKYRILSLLLSVLMPLVLLADDETATISTLLNRCEEARSLSKYESLEADADLLSRQAAAAGDKRAQTYAYFYGGMAKLFTGQTEASLALLDQADAMALRTGNDSVKALVTNIRGIYHAIIEDNRYVAQQFFFKSLEQAKAAGYEDLQYRVRGNLLTLSQSMGGDNALENARAVYEYGQRTHNSEQASMGAYYLATYYYKQERYAEAEPYIAEALNIYKQYPYEDIAAVYSLNAEVLHAQGRTDEARLMALQAIELAQEYHQNSMEVDARLTLAEILNAQKEYRASTEMINTASVKAREADISNKDVTIHQLLARNYSATGNETKALEHLTAANELLRQQGSIDMERLAHEQQVMRDIEQRETDARLKQEQLKAQQNFLILLSIFVLLLMVALVVIIRSYRHTRSLYKKIVIQNTRAIARQEELQAEMELMRKGEDAAIDNIQPEDKPVDEHETSGLDSERVDKLYFKLCHLMDDERLYSEAQLTREKMAEYLGTNRTYLTRIIKEKTGMNYLQFVNSYRINEAIRILSDKDKVSYPLKQIWSDLGFASPSTFFKLFSQTVGMTPTAYRKQFLEVNEEMKENE